MYHLIERQELSSNFNFEHVVRGVWPGPGYLEIRDTSSSVPNSLSGPAESYRAQRGGLPVPKRRLERRAPCIDGLAGSVGPNGAGRQKRGR